MVSTGPVNPLVTRSPGNDIAGRVEEDGKLFTFSDAFGLTDVRFLRIIEASSSSPLPN
jgi:hypothetical protein